MKIVNSCTYSLLFVLGLFISCTNNVTSQTQFGDPIDQEGSISYNALINKLSAIDSLNTKVTGTVSEVCQNKGCWMTIISDDTKEVMRVKFKDYGFFVPKDISGRTVVFEGKAFKEVTPVDELRHYAEDAGKSKEEIEAITNPEENFSFLASGVLLLEN